ncbi:MAG: DUF1641 domain-containing protein [Thermoflexales bacterium]|nr:DUF1641 domain-containing protein [Thermoflexales bacterium]
MSTWLPEEAMRVNGTAETLTALEARVDRLTEQVQYLVAQARAAEQRAEAQADLMRDLTLVLREAFSLAERELAAMQPEITLDDLMRLLRRLLANARTLEVLLDQLESLRDLLDAAKPIPAAAMERLTALLTTLEQKGYFGFLREGMRVVDNVVTSFTEEDVRQLGDNIVLILRTVKTMTQPEIMRFLNRTVIGVEHETEQPLDTSLRGIVNLLRDPHTRRGLALTLRALRTIGMQAQSAESTSNS